MAPEGSDPACDILQKPDRNRPGTLHYGRSVFDPVGNRGAHVNARLGDARGAGQRQRIARLVESDVVSLSLIHISAFAPFSGIENRKRY